MPQLAVAPEPINTEPLSFDALYRECAGDVFAYVMTLLRDRSAGEDVTMSAVERAYRRRRSVDLNRGNATAIWVRKDF